MPHSRISAAVVVIVFCFALLIGIPPVEAPATSNSVRFFCIDSGGHRIASVYYGLTPNLRFAAQLGLIRKRETGLEERTPKFQTIAFRSDQASKCRFVTAAFRESRPAPPRPTQCNGQYMVAQWFDCTIDCDPDGGGQYEEFFSTGQNPCNGYYYPNLTGDCNGCVLAERWCDSCR
jgi:hypothetical protein